MYNNENEDEDKRVVLINNTFFTEEIANLHEILKESIEILNFNKLFQHTTKKKDLINAIENIESVSRALRDLSQKKFMDASLETIFIDTKK